MVATAHYPTAAPRNWSRYLLVLITFLALLAVVNFYSVAVIRWQACQYPHPYMAAALAGNPSVLECMGSIMQNDPASKYRTRTPGLAPSPRTK